MQLSIHLDQVELDAFNRLLDQMAERALNAEPAMQRIADDFLMVERASFASGGATRVGGWPADTTGWVAQKSHRGRGTRTMVYTGTLERSLTEAHAKYSLRVTGPGEVIVGTLDPVAHLHQAGTRERFAHNRNGKPLRHAKFSGKLPRRPVVEVLPADELRWRGFVSEWLTGDGARVGL